MAPAGGHPALAESSRTPASVAWRSRIRGPGSLGRLPPRLLQCGASAGHVVEYNVMVLMVGNRRAPGATTLGGVLEYLICQPSLLCPADGSCTSRWVVQWTVYEMACFQRSELLRQPLPSSTSLRRRYFLSYAVRCDLLGVSSFFFCSPVISFVAARPPDPVAFMPYSTVVSIRLSSRVDKFFVRPSVVASLSWPDRGHHVPALTVTSGGRGVGFDMHAWGRLVVHFSIFFTSRGFGS